MYLKQPEGDQEKCLSIYMILLRSEVAVDKVINGHSPVRSLFLNLSEK